MDRLSRFFTDSARPNSHRIGAILVVLFPIVGIAIWISACRRDTIWLIATAAILATVAALFGEGIRNWIWQPALSVSYVHGPDYCDTPTMRGTFNGQPVAARSYYFRLRVSNVGSRRADKVEILATDLKRREPDETWSIVRRYSLNLSWTHVGVSVLDGLSPRMERFCDVGHIVEPTARAQFVEYHEDFPVAAPDSTVFFVQVEARPNHLSHLLRPGHYRLSLFVAAANHKPIPKTLEFEITGQWSDDLDTMLREGARLRLLGVEDIAAV